MKRLVSSDWQLAGNARDRYRTDFVVKTLPVLIEKHKPDQLLVLGDLTESKDQHPAPLVNEIVNCFHALSKKCEIIILQGNHDILHAAHPFFEFISCFDNISWISVPTERDHCLYLPHTRDYKKDWAGLQFDGYDFIFAHNIFTGVNTSTGHALAGIPPSIIPDDALVISGDVHEPQELANGKIIYVGSPTLCDFGDDYQPRVLLLDNLKVKSIKVYGQQKRLIQCAVNKIAGKRELAFDHNANENDIIKVKVDLDMSDVAEWATIREEIEQWAAKNKFVLNSVVPEISYVMGERQKIVKSTRKADSVYLQSFVKRLGLDEHTAQVGKDLMEG